MMCDIRRAAALLLILVTAGCKNGYEKFYQPFNVPPPPAVQPVDFNGEPRIVASSGNLVDDTRRFYEDGYGPVGQSSFVGPVENQAGAIAQAKKLGAAFAVVWSKYQSTASGAVPFTTTTPQTTYTSGTMSAYGAGGTVNGNYSGTSTTYNSQTTMIPYSVDRYDQVAVYFKPLERRGFGASMGSLSPQQRQQIGTNKGVLVLAVRKGSPAFMADILPGDIVLSINEQAVFDVPSSVAATIAARGGTANVLLIRNGGQVTKAVPIPSGEW